MTLRNLSADDPSVTFDFLKSKYLDPRITLTRASYAPANNPSSGTGTSGGKLQEFNINVPRLTDKGLLLEYANTNYLLNSGTLATQTVVQSQVSGRWMFSFYGTGTVVVSGANSQALLPELANERVSLFRWHGTISDMTLTVTGTVTNAQLEPGDETDFLYPNYDSDCY